MKEEAFASGSTFLHRRDTRVKCIAALALSLVLALNSSLAAAIAGGLLGIILLALSQPAPLLILKRVALVNIFTLFLWITLPLTYHGESMSGIQIATLITLKCNAILFCFLALIATSTTADIGHALEKLGVPPKLTFLLLFSYRQVFIIQQEYNRLQRAASLRGFSPGNNLHSYRTYSHLFGMTLVRSWNRAERVHQAMLLRGFDGTLISLSQQNPGRADYVFLSVLLMTTLLLAIFSLSPHLS